MLARLSRVHRWGLDGGTRTPIALQPLVLEQGHGDDEFPLEFTRKLGVGERMGRDSCTEEDEVGRDSNCSAGACHASLVPVEPLPTQFSESGRSTPLLQRFFGFRRITCTASGRRIKRSQWPICLADGGHV